MTVDTTYTPKRYAGDGTQTTFPVGGQFHTKSWVRCTRTVAGVDADLTQGADFSVTQVGKSGNVVLAAPLAAGATLTVWLDVPATQDQALPASGEFSLPMIEQAMDKLTLLVQQLKEGVSRAVTVGISSTTTPDQIMADLDAKAQQSAANATAAVGAATAADVARGAAVSARTGAETAKAGAEAARDAAQAAQAGAAAAAADAVTAHNSDANAHGGISALAPQTIIKAKLKAPMVYPLHDIQQTDHLTFSGLVATLVASASDPFAAVFGNGAANVVSEIVANLTVTLPGVAGVFWLYVERNPVTGALTLGATDVAPEYAQARRGVDAMPAHTGYSGAFGTVSDTGVSGAGYEGWRAFDKLAQSGATFYQSNIGAFNGSGIGSASLQVVENRPRYLIGYILRTRLGGDGTQNPRTWTLLTSSGDTPDTTVDSQDFSDATVGWVRAFFLPAPVVAKSFKWACTRTNGASAVSVDEFIPLFAEDFYHIQTNKLYKADGTAVQRVYVGKAISNGSSITDVKAFALGKFYTFPVNGGAAPAQGNTYPSDNLLGVGVDEASLSVEAWDGSAWVPAKKYTYSASNYGMESISTRDAVKNYAYGTNAGVVFGSGTNLAWGKTRCTLRRPF